MRCLIQVGITTWVDADAIEAIEWSAYLGHCPKLLLTSGAYVYASKFRDHDDVNGEAKTAELLALLQQVTETACPHGEPHRVEPP